MYFFNYILAKTRQKLISFFFFFYVYSRTHQIVIWDKVELGYMVQKRLVLPSNNKII